MCKVIKILDNQDDWIQIWIDGELFFENHSLNPQDVYKLLLAVTDNVVIHHSDPNNFLELEYWSN